MRALAQLLYIIGLAFAVNVNANVEKTIFLGPGPVLLPYKRVLPDPLSIETLAPANLSVLATKLPVQLPSDLAPRGIEHWYLLRGLEEGRRYEVRICWPAFQPTDFWLDTFALDHVLNTPELLTSLTRWQHSKQREPVTSPPTSLESVLLLRVQAAASYFSTNQTLMNHPPPVDADIILDPFILNLLPYSLRHTAIYITTVSLCAWFISGYIYRWLLSVSNPSNKAHKD